MNLRVVGAGLPRTGTNSLMLAFEHLFDAPCYHMRKIPGHPFTLGEAWDAALAGNPPNWHTIFEGYSAAVDWPTSLFWRELSTAYPDALVVLSVRDSAETWVQSLQHTILPIAQVALAPDWKEGRGLLTLLERFTGTAQWDDPAVLMAAYEKHNLQVMNTIPSNRLLIWQAEQGWEPLCQALNLPIPALPFPWTNKRTEWQQ